MHQEEDVVDPSSIDCCRNGILCWGHNRATTTTGYPACPIAGDDLVDNWLISCQIMIRPIYNSLFQETRTYAPKFRLDNFVIEFHIPRLDFLVPFQ